MSEPPFRAHQVGAVTMSSAGVMCGVIAIAIALRGDATWAFLLTGAAILFAVIGAAITADWRRRLKDHDEL
jgi:hypothetical protein